MRTNSSHERDVLDTQHQGVTPTSVEWMRDVRLESHNTVR